MNDNNQKDTQQVEEKKTCRPWINMDDPAKWIALAITILGIQAWIAGASFINGYWAVPGLTGPFNPQSLQETALAGFIGGFKNWGILGLVIVAFGPIFILCAFSMRKPNCTQSQKSSKLQKWIESKLQFDRDMGRFGVGCMIAGAFFVICFVIPMALWSVGSYFEGRDFFNREVCSVRAGRSVISTIPLSDASTMTGAIIDRSEKMTAVLQDKYIQVVSTGEKQQLLYTITLPEIQCKADGAKQATVKAIDMKSKDGK